MVFNRGQSDIVRRAIISYIMSIDPTKKTKAVKMHLEGKKQKEIAKVIYPDQTPQAGQVSVSRLLNSQEVQREVALALHNHGITIDKAIAPLAEALTATKVSIVGQGNEAFAEVTPDHNIRMRAGKEARELLGVGKTTHKDDTPDALSIEEIHEIASTSDEAELTRLIFRKDNSWYKYR